MRQPEPTGKHYRQEPVTLDTADMETEQPVQEHMAQRDRMEVPERTRPEAIRERTARMAKTDRPVPEKRLRQTEQMTARTEASPVGKHVRDSCAPARKTLRRMTGAPAATARSPITRMSYSAVISRMTLRRLKRSKERWGRLLSAARSWIRTAGSCAAERPLSFSTLRILPIPLP